MLPISTKDCNLDKLNLISLPLFDAQAKKPSCRGDGAAGCRVRAADNQMQWRMCSLDFSATVVCVCVCVWCFHRPVCLAVCVMCYVVMVSAGRNVLESVPPTRRPPTHGRLSSSIPLALPARHNLLSAYLNPYPAFMLVFFSVSGIPPPPSIVILPRLQPRKPNSQNTKCTLTFSPLPLRALLTHLMQVSVISLNALS